MLDNQEYEKFTKEELIYILDLTNLNMIETIRERLLKREESMKFLLDNLIKYEKPQKRINMRKKQLKINCEILHKLDLIEKEREDYYEV